MTAEQFLSLAETLRSYAQHSGRDLNASNLFVHTMLMRAIRGETFDLETCERASREDRAA
ncbi:MAG: hypothetical protein R3C25_04300 [Hyphomonadaceae bacterium]